jgi:hypothetical protein
MKKYISNAVISFFFFFTSFAMHDDMSSQRKIVEGLFESNNEKINWNIYLPSGIGSDETINILLSTVREKLTEILSKEIENIEKIDKIQQLLQLEASKFLKLKIISAQEFHKRLLYILNNLLTKSEELRLPYNATPPAGAITSEQYQKIKAVIGRALAESSDINSLLFMDSCRAEFLPKLSLLERISNNCYPIITGIITEYEGGNPPLSVLPPVDKLIVVSVDATVDLERPHRFLSRVVEVVDGMLGNAKFVGYDDGLEGEPLRISFDQYRIIRDVVNETLTGIRDVPPPEFFQNPRDFLEPLEGLIRESDNPDSQGLREKLIEIHKKIVEIITNFRNPEVSDFVPKNVPFFIVERADDRPPPLFVVERADDRPPPPPVSPAELVEFSDPTVTAQRDTRVRNLHICINEMYFALQAMEIRDDRVLKLFADLVVYAFRFLEIDMEEIRRNLQGDGNREKYIAEAMERRDANVLNAVKAVNYYREFEKCISEIRDQCSGFIKNQKGSAERAMPHYNGWCGIFRRVVGGEKLTEKLIRDSKAARWNLRSRPGDTIREPRVIPGKEGKVEDRKVVGQKLEMVQVTLGEDEVVLDGTSKKVKIIWPPYEYISARPAAKGIPSAGRFEHRGRRK